MHECMQQIFQGHEVASKIASLHNTYACMQKNWQLRIATGGNAGGSLVLPGAHLVSGRSSKDPLVSCISCMKKMNQKLDQYLCMCRPLRAWYTPPVCWVMFAPSSWMRLLRDSTSTSTNSPPLMGCLMILLFSAAHFQVFSIIELSSPCMHKQACMSMCKKKRMFQQKNKTCMF